MLVIVGQKELGFAFQVGKARVSFAVKSAGQILSPRRSSLFDMGCFLRGATRRKEGKSFVVG